MTAIVRNVLWVILLVILHTASANAGECLCDTELYFQVLLEEVSPSAIANCSCCGETAGKVETALLCMRSFSYTYYHSSPRSPSASAEDAAWQRGLEGLLHSYKIRTDLRPSIIKILLTSKSYQDRDHRGRVAAIMKANGQGDLWNTLVAAADGDGTSMKAALYAFCGNFQIIVELTRGPATWEELWPPPKPLAPQKAWKQLACSEMQDQLVMLGIARLPESLAKDFLHLLTKRSLGLLRNAVYAKRGRKFDDQRLQNFFAEQHWYAVDPAYTDGKLTAADNENVKLIRAEEVARP